MSTSHDASGHAAMRAVMSPDPDLNQTDRNIYAYLVYRAGVGRLCWKTVEEIMTDLKIGTRQTVCNATRKLRDKKLIAVKHRRRDSNHYHILDPGELLYPRTSGNGATTWQQPPVQDVKETVFQEPQDVKETALLEPAVDVKETALLEPQDVKETALLEVLDVKKTVHQSLNPVSKITQEKITQGERATASRRTSRRTPLAPGWKPDEKGERYAAERNVAVAPTLEKFHNHHRAHGKVMADWDAAWRTWVANEVRFAWRNPDRPKLGKTGTMLAMLGIAPDVPVYDPEPEPAALRIS